VSFPVKQDKTLSITSISSAREDPRSTRSSLINIPDTDSGVTIIRIEGNKAGVEKAKAELEGMVDKMENESRRISSSAGGQKQRRSLPRRS